MDADLSTSGSDANLNRMVAITVLLLSVFMGLSKIKDDNIIQAMQQAKADAVDHWSEYQAVRTKLHIAETARDEIGLIGAANSAATPILARLDGKIAKYTAEAPRIASDARALEARYDALNFHDDQFDMSDAAVAIALSLAAVASLAETRWLLVAAWVAGGFGIWLGVAGFAGWAVHPDLFARLLS